MSSGSPQPAVLQVVILRDGLLVGTEVFVPGSYALGSNPSSDLVLDDGAVAPEHAFLYFQNGKAAVQDAGSPAGLFVNGHRVNACEIRPVDEVVVGPFVLKVRILAQRPAQKQVHSPKPREAKVPSIPPAAAQPSAQRQQPVQAREAAPSPGVARPRQAKPSLAPPAVAAAGPVASPGIAAPRNSIPPPAHPSNPPSNGTVPSVRRRNGLAVAPGAAAMQYQPDEEVTVAASVEDMKDLLKQQQAPQQKVRAKAPPAFTEPELEAPPPPPPEALVAEDEEPEAAPPPPREARREARAPAPAARKPAANGAHAAKPRGKSSGAGSKRRPHLFALPRKGGKAKLYFELYWHGDRQQARAFDLDKKPLIAGPSEDAALPLYGFKLPPRKFELARRQGDSFRIYVPGSAKVERRGGSGDFAPVSAKDLDVDGTERCFTLNVGQAAKLTEGEMSLFAYVAPTPIMEKVSPLKGLPWLTIIFFCLFGTALASFIAFGPKPEDAPDFTAQKLSPVAVKLMLPEKKKEKPPEKVVKEEPKPEKEKKEKKPPEKVAKKAPKPPPTPTPQAPPETAALKALKKISAGPGTKDILAAMSKLGSGPGAKSNAFKLSGLLGKAPVAINGIGTGGLGGVGGGYGTKGAELLRGRGSGGIGALGVGSVGKGSVQGTVQKAVAHSVAASGSIDRDAVAKVINSHFQEVRACYERALFKEPGLAGKVSLEWGISTAGKVTSAKTKSSSLRNGSVEACILSSIKTWQFPPAKGGTVLITYPFIFESKGF